MFADAFEGQVAADVGAGSDDEMVVRERALDFIICGHMDSLLLQIEALGFAQDEVTDRAKSVTLWSCVNCRRRKVRCDRHQPCAPCTRNKTECIFSLSSRVPRRSRDVNYSNPPAQKKQAELLGRLRRLEAMVGDLGSQVEHAVGVTRGNHLVESLTSATSGTSTTSSETGRPDDRLALYDQTASGYPWTMHDT